MAPRKLTKRSKVLSANEKVEICNCLDMGVNRKYLMKKFNVSASAISSIYSNKTKILSSVSTCDSGESSWLRSTVRNGKLKDLEDALFEWYTDFHFVNAKVTNSVITEKAKSLYRQMNISDQYSFSSGWLNRFKRRYGIRRESVESYEVMNEPVLCGASEIYREFFGTLIAEHDLSPDQIYSACEIKLFWRSLLESKQSYRGRPSKGIMIGEQDKITVFLCANASGRHKVNLFAVGEEKLKSSSTNSDCPVEYNVQRDGVMNKALYILWFEKVFVPSVKLNLKSCGKPENSHVLLLFDKCAQDILNSELVFENIFSTFIPSNVSSVILPINKGVAHDFVCNYRIDVMKKICNQEMSPDYFLSQYCMEDVIDYLGSAWECVNPEVLRKSWLHLLPSSSLWEMCEMDGYFRSNSIQDSTSDN